MKLNLRILLPLIGIIVLLGVGAALLRRGASSPANGNGNAPVAVNHSVAAVDPVGTPLNANLAVGRESLSVLKVFRAPRYRVSDAGAGMEFIVVEFRPLRAGATDIAAAASATTLTAGGQSYAPRIIELPTVEDSPDGNGALVFPVPVGAANPVLHVGGGETLTLPI